MFTTVCSLCNMESSTLATALNRCVKSNIPFLEKREYLSHSLPRGVRASSSLSPLSSSTPLLHPLSLLLPPNTNNSSQDPTLLRSLACCEPLHLNVCYCLHTTCQCLRSYTSPLVASLPRPAICEMPASMLLWLRSDSFRHARCGVIMCPPVALGSLLPSPDGVKRTLCCLVERYPVLPRPDFRYIAYILKVPVRDNDLLGLPPQVPNCNGFLIAVPARALSRGLTVLTFR
ncbi:hypothetical protein C8Q78DRAFT_396484 [Trametes maxima]|nr:hypothetical protein C8Q78DRAFT_396484 [Trametes maxima]